MLLETAEKRQARASEKLPNMRLNASAQRWRVRPFGRPCSWERASGGGQHCADLLLLEVLLLLQRHLLRRVLLRLLLQHSRRQVGVRREVRVECGARQAARLRVRQRSCCELLRAQCARRPLRATTTAPAAQFERRYYLAIIQFTERPPGLHIFS